MIYSFYSSKFLKRVYPYFIFLMIFVIFTVTVMPTSMAVSFWDIKSNHWAYKFVISLTSQNVINGYEDGSFKPEGTITNAEFIKLVTVSALPDWVDVNDAESKINHWAGKYLWIAERYGIVSKGAYNLTNLDKPITRIEMVRIISKADIIIKGNQMSTNKKVTFNDVLSLNNNDLMMLRHACSRGLIAGYSDNSFKPYNNMTRAEAATMIYRFSK